MVFLHWNDSSCHRSLSSLLRSNQVILGDSDTVLGLFCQATSANARLLDEIKGRSNKPYIILIESIAKAHVYVDEHILSYWQLLLDTFWPGPLTIIFTARKDLEIGIKSAQGTVALRVPDHQGLQSLLCHFDGLFSTSANLTNDPPPASIEDVNPKIMASVAAVIKDMDNRASIPSTILDCTGEKARLVRQGSISKESIEAILGYSI